MCLDRTIIGLVALFGSSDRPTEERTVRSEDDLRNDTVGVAGPADGIVMQREKRDREDPFFENRRVGVRRPTFATADESLRRVAVDRNISELLVDAGIVTREQFNEAVQMKRERGGNIVDNLMSLSHLSPSVLVDFFLAHPGAIGVYASYVAISENLIGLVSPALAQKHKIIPLDRVGNTLVVGAMDPLSEEGVREIEAETGLRPKILLCSQQNLQTAIEFHYARRHEEEEKPVPTVPSEGDLRNDTVEERVAELPPTAGEKDEAQFERWHASTKLSHVAHLIRQIASLPALPETVVRVRHVMDNAASTVRDVVNVVTLDPPLAAKVLSVANSAAYGFRHRIKDLTHAISLLGFRETYGIVLSVAVADLANKLKHFDYRSFWLESMYSAAAARVVAKACGQKFLAGVFSAGLLHDLGRVVLLELQPNYARELPRYIWGKELVVEEEKSIGIGHPEAGYELANHWDLPPEIAEPIRFHHAPERATAQKMHVSIVALANVMACAPGESLENNKGVFRGYEAALEFLRLDTEIAEAMLDEFLGLRGATLNSLEERDDSP